MHIHLRQFASSATAITSITALLLGGCTEIRTAAPLQSPPPGAVNAGYSYWLPRSKVDATVGLVLTDCVKLKDWDKIAPKDKKVAEPVAAIGFKLVGNIDASTQRGQQVQIDYRKMVDFLKTGSLKLDRHPNGMLKSVNASLADESPEALAAVAKAAVAVASLAAGRPDVAALAAGIASAKSSKSTPAPQPMAIMKSGGGKKAASPPKLTKSTVTTKTMNVSYQTCTPYAMDLLAKAKTLADDADAADVAIDKALANLVELLATPGGMTGDQYANLKASRDKLNELLTRKSAASTALAANTAKRTLALQSNDVAQKLHGASFAAKQPARDAFVRKMFIYDTATLPVTSIAATARADGLLRVALQNVTTTTESSTSNGKTTSKSTTVTLNYEIVADGIDPLLDRMAQAKVEVACNGDAATCPALPASNASLLFPAVAAKPPAVPPPVGTKKPAKAEKLPPNLVAASKSIIYVEPVKLKVSLTGPQLTVDTSGDQMDIGFNNSGAIASALAAFPEQGQFWGLSLKSDFGEKSALEATFAEDGSLLTGSFTRSASMGKALASASQTVLEGIVSARDAAEARQVAAIDQQTKLLKAEQGRQDAASKLTPEEAAEIDKQIAALAKDKTVAEARVAIGQANKTLADLAKPATAPEAPSALDQKAAERAKERAIAEADVAIAKAKKELEALSKPGAPPTP